MSEHGHCPNCGVDLDGGSIWQTFFDQYQSAERADEAAEMFGATREKGRWGREIGIYDMEQDRTVMWECPDCGHQWKR